MKTRNIKNLSLSLLLSALSFFIVFISCDKLAYMSLQRPVVDIVNEKYVRNLTVISNRVGRKNPVYYVNIRGTVLEPISNKFKADFYFLEFLTNEYKPSFVELHYRICDMVEKDKLFGAAMKKSMPGTCPYPAGTYYMSNITIMPTSIPRGFPFTKGRIVLNATVAKTGELALRAYIDFEIKHISVEKNNFNKTF